MKYNTKWEYYYKKTDFVFFIIDFTIDNKEFLVAKDELQNFLYQNSTPNRPLLVLANKDEIEGINKINEVSIKLDLIKLKRIDVSYFSFSVKNRNNYSSISNWIKNKSILITQINKKYINN